MTHPPPACVEPLLRSTLAPLLRQFPHPIRVEIDLSDDLPTVTTPDVFCDLVRSLVHEALDQMPHGGELTLTGCCTAEGWDLEIADTGAAAETRPQSKRFTASVLGANLQWQNCPQGGCAVTVHFRSPVRRARAA